MAQTKMSPAAKMKSLDSYVQSLTSGAPAQATLGDLLGSRVDRVRLWQDDNQQKVMVKEVALPKLVGKPKGKRRVSPGLDPDFVTILDQIEDPEISVDLTLNLDSGAVSLAVEMEPALIGEDLSAFSGEASDGALPVFDDEPFDDAFWSADEAATYFGVAKSTITRKIKANDLIGFKLFKNALYVPKDQVEGKTLIKGIKDVLDMFAADHYAAWQFLTADTFYGEADARPLDRLRHASSASLPTVLAEIKVAKEGFDYGDHI